MFKIEVKLGAGAIKVFFKPMKRLCIDMKYSNRFPSVLPPWLNSPRPWLRQPSAAVID
jgi:hypothetical protein